MRRFALIAAAAALVACSPAQAPKKTAEASAPAAPTCTQEVTKTVALTSPDAKDLVTVRSFAAPPIPESFKTEDTTNNGALCTNAVVLMTIHSAQNSAPLISFASQATAIDMVGGAAPTAFDAAGMKKLLEGLAAVEISTADKAPAFGAANVATDLDRTEYTALKSTKGPMACIKETIHNRVCYAMVGAAPYVRADVFFVEDLS